VSAESKFQQAVENRIQFAIDLLQLEYTAKPMTVEEEKRTCGDLEDSQIDRIYMYTLNID